MISRHVVLRYCQVLGSLAVLGLVGLPPCAAASASTAPPPRAMALPSALPPLTVGIDSLDCSLRLDLRPRAGPSVHPDNRLQLTMSLPLHGALLRIDSVTLGRVRSDSGEYLAVVTRPLIHEQHLTAESPANRERVLHIPCALSPPFLPCSRILGLHGAMTLVMAHGSPASAQLSAQIGASVDCGALGAVSIVERSAHGWQVRIPAALTDQLAEMVGLDAGGVELVSHAHPVTFADGGTATEVDCDLASCAALRIAWWPAVATCVIPIDIPVIEVPGGVTTIGGLDLGTQGAGATTMDDATTVAVLLDHHPLPPADPLATLNALALGVTRGNLPIVRLVMAGGADPYALLPDGSTCVDKAMTLERWRALSLMLGNPEPK